MKLPEPDVEPLNLKSNYNVIIRFISYAWRAALVNYFLHLVLNSTRFDRLFLCRLRISSLTRSSQERINDSDQDPANLLYDSL